MIKALSKVDKFIKQTQLLKEHKLVYELFAPAQFEQRLLTIPSPRWRVILYWSTMARDGLQNGSGNLTQFSSLMLFPAKLSEAGKNNFL